MKKSIKVIKREQRGFPLEPDPVPAGDSKTDNQLRRHIAQTVSSWIEERRDQLANNRLKFKLLPTERPSSQ
jgi:hypothetical protein